jgi:predicted Zn finger-like uncharacterized protein
MILTCPQCATRYQVDGTKFPAAGRNVRCAKCAHVWHQLGPAPEPDPEAEIVVEEPAPPPAPEPARIMAFAPSHESTVVAAPEEPAAPRSASPWLGRAAIAGGWIVLIGLVVTIGWAAVSFRNAIATWLPQTSSVYAAAGLPVSSRGVDFADVGRALETEDGQQVLAVTGRIVNHSDRELSVPLVRVALIDADRHELYHWTFVPPIATLQPGAAEKFRTRLSSPPAATHDIEVRFAKPGE